ncbi:MAG: DUF4810 domain-containing protein [Gammaproteobacteria bacterium]|nr:DUF4810 domain-containing protein [Gammaproteobacteria bacterium]
MKKIICGLVATLAILSGCAATVTEAGYYWGDYSQTLYKYTVDPSDVTLANHVEELENIIETSREKGLRVPPGVHAELGYIKARQGNDAAATAHYETEMSLYPESRLFLERLTVETKKGSKTS